MLELVDSFHLGWNGFISVQVQVLLPILTKKRKQKTILLRLSAFYTAFLYVLAYLTLKTVKRYVKKRKKTLNAIINSKKMPTIS